MTGRELAEKIAGIDEKIQVEVIIDSISVWIKADSCNLIVHFNMNIGYKETDMDILLLNDIDYCLVNTKA